MRRSPRPRRITFLFAGSALAFVATAAVLLTPGSGSDGLHRLAAGPAFTPTPTKPPSLNATAKVIADSAHLIEGPTSRGRLGDYLLANSEIQVVIQAPQRNLLNVGQYGGQIIDADLVRGTGDPERDSFEEWAFGINLESTAHYTKVNIVNDGSNGQPAVIRATGVDDLLDFINPSSQVADFGLPFPTEFDDADLPVEITTDYILAPNDNFVQVDTTVRNVDTTETIETFFTEYLGVSGTVEQFLAGYGFGEPLVTTTCALCNFIAWSGERLADGVSYGYIHDVDLDGDLTDSSTIFSTSGVTIPILDADAALALIGGVEPNVTIAPQDELTATRYFAVGDGSVGSIVDIRNEILGLATGTISGTVTRGGSPVEGADVVVIGDQAEGPGTAKNVVSHYRTDANGDYSGTLPPGDYTVRTHLDGHLAATPDPANVTITASNTTSQNFTIPQTGRVKVTIVDEASAAISGKVSIVGFDPYTDPENTQTVLGFVDNTTALFGDIFHDELPYGLARVVFVNQTGDSGEFFIEPGDYRVVVSHGTEYSIFEQDITVTAGNLTTVNAQIARVIDTTGFVSGDFHVHQLNSPDSKVTLEERVISMIAEGVDFFTPSDHEHRTDLAPTISSLGVGSLISVGVNAETTTPDYGHFNAWPMTIDATKVNNGAIDWAGAAPAGEDFPSFGNYGLSPAEIIAALHADPGKDAVQINHIDSFFGPGGLSIDTSYAPPQDFADNQSKRLDPTIPNLFDDGFTALEVWQGTDRNDIDRTTERRMGDWFNLINQGIIRSAITVSDTHKRIDTQAGFPRTFLASSTDDPGALGALAESLAVNANNGKATGTNGPFVTVTADASSTGENGGLGLNDPNLVSTTDGSATITVDIQSPLWAEFDTVEFYVNNVPSPNDFDSDASTPPLWPVEPDVVHTAGVDFTVNTVNVTGGQRLEATTSLDLTGLTEDTWVVVLVRGNDNVSEPIFPVVPNDLDEAANPTLADLIDGNLGELGVTAMAYTNPLFIDVNNNDTYDTHPVDNDRDGCTNDQELAPKTNAAQGGGRSPSNFWDLLDVPTGTNFTRDRTVDIGDILAIVLRFGQNDQDGTAPVNRTTSPLSTPPPSGLPKPDSYHPAYDRGGSIAGQNAWNLQPANGLINIGDILAAVLQFGHSCAGA